MSYSKNEVVLVRYPFSDLTNFKVHLAIIVNAPHVSQRAIFIAHDSTFRKGKVIEPFENVHIYNLMTMILRLKPAKTDGNFSLAEQILR